MADFHKAFEAIDEDGSGEITVAELENYMKKSNYKPTFVKKWLNLFDKDDSGKITYQQYCETLGLVPRQKPVQIVNEPVIEAEQKIAEQSSNSMDCSDETALDRPKEAKADRVKKQEPSISFGKKKRSSKNRGKCFSKHKRRLRSSIKPGSVLILLSGRHRGKRVIFLNQLLSGLLLVTGPYKINGCPLRRVHQNMVIATKTRLDMEDIHISDHLNDEYFSCQDDDNEKKRKSKQDVGDIFAKTTKQYTLKESRKQDQKVVDAQILRAIKNHSDKTMLVRYLRSPFTLTGHDLPHKMEF